MRSLFPIGLALGLVAAAPAQDPTKLRGKPIPAITMKRVGGGTVSTAALKGKVVILDFWATWCAPCIAASPVMQNLYAKYGKQGFVVVGSNVTDTEAKATAYVKKHGYTYPFTFDNTGVAGTLGVVGLPVFVFIDRKGIVQRVDTGFPSGSAKSWEATVQQLLKG